jgi:hypothetical protein
MEIDGAAGDITLVRPAAAAPPRRSGRDALDIEGDVRARDCVVRYRKGGKVRAVASIYRDVDNLAAEIAMEST